MIGACFFVADDDQHLIVLHHASFDFRLKPTSNKLNFQQSLLRVTDFDACLPVRVNFISPLMNLNEGSFRIRTATAVEWRGCFQVANRSITGNGQQVLRAAIVQIAANAVVLPVSASAATQACGSK